MQALVERIPAPLRAPLAWFAAVLFALALHWDGLQCWFFQDDFAWLGLLRHVHSAGDVWIQLFDPAAQGTMRPLSERGFFLLFEQLFGYDNLPFRIAAFAVMFANVALLMWLTRRITGSRLAGFAAVVIWMSNAALMTVMTWSSAFNEALCPFLLMAALALFIRYAETGSRVFWWAQLAVFVTGFGALETNVVYPALAAAWVLFATPVEQRRSLLRSLIAPFLISIVYFAIHRAVAPIPQAGAYSVHIDRQLLTSLKLYLEWSLVPVDFFKFGHLHRYALLTWLVCGGALAALLVHELMARRYRVLFFAAWFLITLAPVLPLPEHRTDYYLTMPLIGLAMAGGYALSRWPMLAALPCMIYLAAMIPVTRAADHWALTRTEAVRQMVEGVEEAHQRHPAKIILLNGVTTDLFNDAFGHSPFFPLDIKDVYLTPGSEKTIKPVPELMSLNEAVLEPWVSHRALERGDAVIYSISGDHLRNITEAYERSAPNLLASGLPAHVDVGNPLFSALLGPEWLPAESGFRWMPASARLKLRGPGANGGNLTIDGYCPAEQLRQAPRRLWVIVDGLAVGETKIDDPESTFHRLFPLPRALWGKATVEVELRVDPVVTRDGRQYGLVFGRVGIEP